MTPSIVCGIDTSPQADTALSVASALAERLGRRLILVHTVQTPTPDVLLTAPARVPAGVEQIDLLGHDTGERLLAQAVDEHDLPDAERRLERGGAAERLCATARQEHAEFIVVGSRGAGRLSSALLGSVSTAVVRDAPCPVVVVPPAMTGPALDGERILCGFQSEADGAAMTVGSRLARDLDMPILVAHILPTRPKVTPLAPADVLRATAEHRPEADRSHALHTIRRVLETAGEETSTRQHQIRLRNGDPAGELLELAASTRAMLLIVGSRRLGPLRGGLFGSVSQELVRHATRPVVICRQNEFT